MAPQVTRREFLNAAAVSTLTAPHLSASVAAERPNLLFILADDLGYGDLSCYGRPDYKTPVLDAFATQGIKFMSAYAAAPVCTPTRCAFITGRYPQRFEVGLYEPLRTQGQDLEKGLPPDQPTIASRLRANGYDTALIGKWHLGWKPEFGPNRHGFDEFFGILAGAGDYFTHADDRGTADLWENLTPVDRVGYLTDLLSDRAVEYVSRKRTRPFYLSLHYTAPHSPWEGPDDRAIAHRDHGPGPMVNGGSRPIYGEMMKRMDAGIGKVLDALKRAKIEGRTLVIFTSDNGGERYSYNWPFSLQKFYLFEGGIRVPAIVRWPGVIPAGRVTEQAAITMDWSATLLAVSGTSPDPNAALDGEDLSSLCRGTRPAFDRTLFWRTQTREAARAGKWKYLNDEGKESLFDLLMDPGEKNDVRTTQQETFDRLREQYRTWNRSMLPRLEKV